MILPVPSVEPSLMMIHSWGRIVCRSMHSMVERRYCSSSRTGVSTTYLGCAKLMFAPGLTGALKSRAPDSSAVLSIDDSSNCCSFPGICKPFKTRLPYFEYHCSRFVGQEKFPRTGFFPRLDRIRLAATRGPEDSFAGKRSHLCGPEPARL